ncbi:MAG: hypothetical protein AAF791_12005 [Bacteroidota bacterium]
MSEPTASYTTGREPIASVPDLVNVSEDALNLFLAYVIGGARWYHTPTGIEGLFTPAMRERMRPPLVAGRAASVRGRFQPPPDHVYASDPALTPTLIEAVCDWKGWGNGCSADIRYQEGWRRLGDEAGWCVSFVAREMSVCTYAGPDQLAHAVARAAILALWPQAPPEAQAFITEAVTDAETARLGAVTEG